MSIESRLLAARGDLFLNTTAAGEQLRTGDRSQAVAYAARAAGNILQYLTYGSILTFDYAIANEPGYPPVDKNLERNYGLTVGAAAGVLKAGSVELPSSFAQMLEASSPNK